MINSKLYPLARKLETFGLVTAVVVTSVLIPTEADAYSGFSGDYTRSERLTQPYVSYDFAPNELGVVNFAPKWGDKEANIESMKEYIKEADAKGVKILLFPEMCVTGYVSSSDPDSKAYKWAVDSAEPLNGPTAEIFAKLADDNDMWIIYGATQTIDGDADHAYNSAFACSPEGDVTAYQKITPVEGEWCVPGETPVLIDAGEYGKLGLSICYDTYSSPEIERYYSAMGCNLLLNPTATGGGWSAADMGAWEEYYRVRLESIASRDGFTILSSDLVGTDGADDQYNFPGGSVILNGQFNGARYYAGAEKSDGEVVTEASIVTGKEGLLTNTVALTASTGSTCSDSDFNPEMYTELYKELADKEAAGESLSYKPVTTEGPKVATVNMTAYWGNKDRTKAKMIKYIEQAGKEGVNILVFPETVLTGYDYLEPDKDPFYHKYGKSMQVATAETIPGPTTNELSEYAKKYNMYIIFGMTEKDEKGEIYDSNDNNVLDTAEKVYNSAAILYPDGTIDSYQKIHRAGNKERQWSVCGSTPKIIETPWGKAGIDICRDGHFYPELGRYYAAMGCTLFIHPTATGGNAWYRATRIGSYTARDGMAAITSNLLGGDGIYTAPGDKSYDPADDETNFDEKGNFIGGSEIPDDIKNKNEVADDPYWNGENWSYGSMFASTSIVITKNGSRLNYNGTGSASEGFAERGGTSPLGLEIATMDLTGCGFSGVFNPSLYSKMYDKLASLYRGGYTSIYDEGAVAEPITINLSANASDNIKAPAKGTKLIDNKTNDVYKVISAESKNASVTFVKSGKKSAKTITIPNTVKIDGITYKVTSINKGAFKNNKKITKVVIPANVTKIGASSFSGCNSLKNIVIKSEKLTSKSIGKNAFKGISSKAKITVPKNKLSAYKKLFKNAGIKANIVK